MVTEGFTIAGVFGLLFTLVTFVTLGQQQKVGYILFMVTNTLAIVFISLIYGMFFLALFGITLFEKINPFRFMARMHGSINYIELAKFTGIIVVLIIILLAIRVYYKKRKGLFN